MKKFNIGQRVRTDDGSAVGTVTLTDSRTGLVEYVVDHQCLLGENDDGYRLAPEGDLEGLES